MDKYTGKRLDGRYEIHELVGVGGMALVYRAYDTLDQRVVAIKILKDEYLHNAEFIRRFKNESKAIALLSHPNIIKVYDVSFGDQIQYIVEEFIDGITLKQYLDQQAGVDWHKALHFTTEILQALQHAHERGIVHRDIKPQNIMVLPNGHIKVTDFGIARFARSETRTMTDKAIGSVHYIAPEQARGDLTDEKADIYSVGVMLYEMTTGQLPFEAENAVSVAIMQLQTDPCPPRQINPDLPVGLEEITLKAMQKDPVQRYQSAAEMLRDIGLFQQNPGIRFHYQYYSGDNSTRYVDPETTADLNSPEGYSDDYVYTEDGEAGNQAGTKTKARNKAPLIAAGIAAAFAVVALILLLTGVFRSQKQVTLDNFIGKTIAAVEANNPNNFQFEIKYVTDSTKDTGLITAQDPAAGTSVAAGSKVTLTVVKSVDATTVPDVTNQTKTAAEQTLRESGLVAVFQEQSSDTIEEGKAVSTDPSAGTSIEKGKNVTVYISTGPGELSIPNVTGQTLDQATAVLTNAGFKVNASVQDNTGKEANYVVGTTPEAGSSAKKGDTVTILYSSGKNEKEIKVVVQLPANVNHSMVLSYYLDGEKKGDAVVNPAANNTWTGQFKDTEGVKELLVELDGQNYVKYKLDFTTGNWVVSWQGTYKDAQASSQNSTAASSQPQQSVPASPPATSSTAEPSASTSASAPTEES
ncbi:MULTISPECIES: Stk1 family PASTA domain-containing Ser/Thr kinase [Caproicibacterium]|uniref:non-specific serine/threonine protein kinase n=1 Tax=Caproicibacterium argilliputei TaxID=3030016 RepID=A0AA97GZZ1_9FIRM|nr:Stk1 family PASTA domain-containing Ser/Thr kinase [Caproicibacterium argilliputei]WOC31036.1 Stk1 family PASTA domain-containing Ser/Thr kinase [Caproicibacterium argilliputei]